MLRKMWPCIVGLLSLPVCATSVGKEVTCKQSVIKSAAAPDKAVKQVVPSSDGSSLDQLLKGNDDTDDLGLWNITGGLTQGYQVHLKVDCKPVQMELDTGTAMPEQQWKALTNGKPVKPYQGKPL